MKSLMLYGIWIRIIQTIFFISSSHSLITNNELKYCEKSNKIEKIFLLHAVNSLKIILKFLHDVKRKSASFLYGNIYLPTLKSWQKIVLSIWKVFLFQALCVRAHLCVHLGTAVQFHLHSETKKKLMYKIMPYAAYFQLLVEL